MDAGVPGTGPTAVPAVGWQWLAGGIWVTALLLVAVAVPYAMHVDGSVEDVVFVPLACLALVSVGAVVASKRPGHPIGWILLGSGWLVSLGAVAHAHALHAVLGGVSARSGGWAVLIENVTFTTGFVTLVLFIALLFPDGHVLSHRWRILAWAAGVAIAAEAVVGLLRPGPFGAVFPGLSNPVGVPAAASMVAAFDTWAVLVVGPIMAAALAAVVIRFVRSRGITRQQFKWVALPAAALVVFNALNAVVVTESAVVGAALLVAFWTAVIGLPVGVGVAILRLRLYEIDRIVRRTVTYSLVVTVLGAVFAGTVVLATSLLPVQGDLAVAVATLGAAAAFRPVRIRIRGAVERRYNRPRYDAQQAIERFGSTLRMQLDPEGIVSDMTIAADQVLRPTHVSVWIPATRD